jgi:general secretion pathway protein L
VGGAAPPGRAATALEFNGSELRVRGLAASEAEARPVLQALRSQGYAGMLQGDTLVVRAEGQP